MFTKRWMLTFVVAAGAIVGGFSLFQGSEAEQEAERRRRAAATLATQEVADAGASTAVSSSVAAPSSALPSHTSPGDGHDRLVQLLQTIRQRTSTDNPYLGDRDARMLEEQLALLSDDSPVGQRFETLNKLGMKELQLGETADAIRRFQACLELVPPQWTDVRDRVEHQLAVAYLRQGENENCVFCCNGDSCILPIRGKGLHEHPAGSQAAVRHLTTILERSPDNVVARWLLNIAHMTLGQYPDRVPERWRISPDRFQSSESFPRFENIAQELGLDELSLAGGMIVDDLNNDGWLDVLTSQWSTAGQLRCYLARGDGTFEDTTEDAGLTGLYGGLNLVQADYDNDGDIDVLVLRGGWWGEAGRHPNSLLANDGAAHFRDVTFDAGLGDVHYPTQTGAWSDYDNDGDLDLYVGNEEFPCQLFANDGQGHFQDVAAQAGVADGGFAKGVTWGDYNGDRFPDLYVSNLVGSNHLFRNNQDGTFTNVAAKLGVERPERSFPTWFWDYNNDGLLDLYVGAYTSNISVFAADFLGMSHVGETDRLFQGQPGGGFRDVSESAHIARVTVPMGANFGDLDNDGFLDYYLGTGDPNFDSLMPNRLFWNRRGKHFADVSMAAGVAHLQKGHGIAFADYDHDGDQDIFIEMGGAYPGDAFLNTVFQNPGFGNHWLSVKLIGTTSNRMGVGARVRVEFTEADGTQRSIYRWMNSGGSFGANPLRLHVGLGQATSAKLEVYWPVTDRTQTWDGVPADQIIQVWEDRAQWDKMPITQSQRRNEGSL